MTQKERLYDMSIESLQRVVEYMENAEEKHYDESTEEEQINHIYRDVLVLETLLRHTVQEEIKGFHDTFGEEQTCGFPRYCNIC